MAHRREFFLSPAAKLYEQVRSPSPCLLSNGATFTDACRLNETTSGGLALTSFFFSH